MATGSIITNNGKKSILYRAFTANASLSATTYLAPTQFSVGISNGTPNVADTNLDIPIPITNGTINDNGDNQLTGSSGGDNTTDNTTTFKQGGNVTDDTAQNLIANGTNASKIWTIANLAALGSVVTGTQYYGLWLYIKDATALAKLVSVGTAISIKFRTNGDAANKYYEDAYEDGDVTTGWNWISSGSTIVTGLTAGVGGAPSGILNEFVITITTNNATDTFVAGDVVYDLLRTWEATDLKKDYDSGYPSIDLTNLEVTTIGTVASTQGSGFDINGYADFDESTIPEMKSEDTITAESKSRDEEFRFRTKNIII